MFLTDLRVFIIQVNLKELTTALQHWVFFFCTSHQCSLSKYVINIWLEIGCNQLKFCTSVVQLLICTVCSRRVSILLHKCIGYQI